jgi:hypothetical protein
MTTQALIKKLHQLSPERLDEVEDFVDFLAQRYERESNHQLTKAAAEASADAFKKVWENPEDTVYDYL